MRVYATILPLALLFLPADRSAAHAQGRRLPDVGTSRRTPTPDVTAADPRSQLGLVVAPSGTERDTLGLLVTEVLREGPAERAGIDEGNRIAEIDGVSLRVDASDVGRSGSGDAAVRRLMRTLSGLRDAEQARLRVFGSGRYRTVTIRLGGPPNVGVAAAPAPAAMPNVAVAGEPATRSVTVASAIQSLDDLQGQLRRLADDEGSTPLADSLAQSARELGAIQRRLRAAQAEQRRRAESATDDRVAGSRRGGPDVRGLSLSAVTDELADYFGEGSDRGLLVLQAESSWDPIRAGDVILSVDGAPVTADRLRDVADSRRPVRLELLRRRRHTSVTLHGREDR